MVAIFAAKTCIKYAGVWHTSKSHPLNQEPSYRVIWQKGKEFSGILAMILLVVVGKMIDARGKLGIHSVGVGINTILHLTRPFFKSTAFLYGNGIIDNINSPAYGVPFNAAIYEKSLEGSVSDFIVYRELVMHGIRLIVLAFVALVLFYTNSWTWTFYVGALGSVLTILVN